MNVTLIGYRGSGKSAVSAHLADALGWTAVDADHEIERRAGRTIREIFEEKGEPHFRQLERDVLAELLAGDRLVIAAGGGAVLSTETRSRMQAAGPVVWLQATVDQLERRINADAKSPQRRPPLTDSGGRHEIEELLNVREPLYRQSATAIVQTDELTVEDVAKAVLASVKPLLRKDR
jgi:shikimate kinase